MAGTAKQAAINERNGLRINVPARFFSTTYSLDQQPYRLKRVLECATGV
jgi:hypothetical protein